MRWASCAATTHAGEGTDGRMAAQGRTGVVIVGPGMIAGWHARAIAESDRLELVAVAGRSLERAAAFCREHGGEPYNDLDKALSRPDADMLVVATPSGVHDEAVCAAIRHSKPVLCDKPLTLTVARAEALLAEAAAARVQVGVICQTRWIPAMDAAGRALRVGRLGRITFARIDCPWWYEQEYFTSSPWHGTKSLDGGTLFTQGIHMIDWLVDLMPPVVDVIGYRAALAHPGIETEDVVSAALRFEGGALGAIYVTTASWPGRPRRLELTGTRGPIAIEDYSIATWALADGSLPDLPEPVRRAGFGVAPSTGIETGPIRRCFEAFVDSLHGGAPYPGDGKAALASISVIERIVGG